MIHVFKKRYPNAVVKLNGADLTIRMDFRDAVEKPEKPSVCAC